MRSTKKIGLENFIKKSNKIHKNKYDYSKTVYKNCNTKVCIICPKHGEFWQTPHAHLRGNGCVECGKEIRRNSTFKKKIIDKDSFIQRANEIHSNKYDYSNVEYINITTPIKIYCPIHGYFTQTPAKHIHRKQGCPKCNGGVKYTTQDFIEKSNIIHSNEYDYSQTVYVNNHTIVDIICHKIDKNGVEHGTFRQLPLNHIKHHGCPKCKRSLLESEMEMFLNKHGIEYEREKKFPWLIDKSFMRLDFYLPKYKVAIECQGQQHYEPYEKFGGEETFINGARRDNLKKELCDLNNINLIYFSDFKYKRDVIIDKNKILEILNYESTD